MADFLFRWPQRWNAEPADGGYFQELANGSDSTGGGYGNGSASDSKSKGWEFESVWFHFLKVLGSHACPDYREAGLQGCGRIACNVKGLLRELSPGFLAPWARIIPLDQAADTVNTSALLRRPTPH